MSPNYLHLTRQAHRQVSPLSKTTYDGPASLCVSSHSTKTQQHFRVHHLAYVKHARCCCGGAKSTRTGHKLRGKRCVIEGCNCKIERARRPSCKIPLITLPHAPPHLLGGSTLIIRRKVYGGCKRGLF